MGIPPETAPPDIVLLGILAVSCCKLSDPRLVRISRVASSFDPASLFRVNTTSSLYTVNGSFVPCSN
jgi:hypothetical protein